MKTDRQAWLDALGYPAVKQNNDSLALLCTYQYSDYTLELYSQPLQDGTHQRVMIALPKNVAFPAPAVVIPFYYPEAMLGFDPATGETLDNFAGIEMMVHLAKRGYITACADAYHLTYLQSDKPRDDFSRWRDAASALYRDHPHWSGMGKLVQDTVRLIDAVETHPNVDASRIAIAGHSLGGKMAFYTGCLDKRICAILASDFGFGWEQSNWDVPWYWNGKVQTLCEKGLDHVGLLDIASPKPFCLLAGEFDDKSSGTKMQQALGYADTPDRLRLIHHGKGHRPPQDALEQGYDFLELCLQK